MSEKKVGKRLLTWVLVLVMTLSLLPLNVLAAEVDGQPKSSVEKTDGAVNIKKSVSEEGSELTLEAWVTDEKSTMQTYVPMDIVLVLDVSGSMDEKTESYAYQKTEKTKWTPSDIRWASETFYAKLDGEYYPVSYKHTRVDGHWDHYQWIPGYDQYWLEANGQMIGKKVSGFLETFYRGDLYTYSKVTGTQTKLQAMQKAVNSFIDSVAAKKDGDKAVDHKIGIVKFSGNKSDSIGNTTYKKSGYTYNHTQVLKGLTDVTTGAKQLKSSVDSLKAAGCTSADYGMEKATELLNKRNGDAAKCPAVVIMFTDGEPTRKSDYDKGVAGAAVEAAKGLKDKGIKVYTIGMFGEANPSDTSNEFNQYMHGVSSNYPNAVNDKNSSSGVNLGTRASGNYYFAATNAGELDKIFQSIGQEVSSLKLDVGKNTVLSDTLSSYFELKAPEGAENSGITVMMANIANDGNSWENATPASDVSVTITDGKTIKVTGFDYKANAVTKRTDGTYSGAKLIITIPIKPNPDAAWEADTKNYPTNETTGDKQAGLIYKDEAGREAKTLLDKSPTVQQTAYTVTFVAGENGRLTGETSYTVLKDTAWSEIAVPTPSANSGYKFKDWTPEFPETITESKTYTANFETDNGDFGTIQLGDFIYKNFESRYGASTEETFYAYATVTPYFVYAPEQPAEPEQTEQSEQVGEPEQSSEPEQPAAPEQPGQSEQQPGQSEQQPATPSETPASEQQPVIEVSNSLTLDDGLVKYEGSVKLKTGYSNPFKFEEISLTEGTYRVEVHEHDDGKDNIVYDDTTYFFILTVDEDGSYSASDFAFCAEDSNERIPMDSAEKVEFTNEYTYRRPHHPRPKPTVEIEDDDALGLNTTDHFAYIVGYGNGEVRPQNNITRAEVATIFFRLLTDDVRDENLTKTNRYSDVTRADWYNTAVSTLSSMGIITGYPDGTFRPNAAITRAEFAAIAARFDNDGD
ncbi:MAG: S-layer homology domain-containing protein, partial [Oscillospiraceae bacterium]|nr:S-layer homology domain-containing protein [Oscillospiraceae bacterium]